MHDDVNQKISQLLDNELDQDEALSILQKIQLQPSLKNKKDRYEAIGHVLKADVFLCPSPDFTTRVNQQVQKEPFYLLPRSHQPSERKSSNRSYKTLALAASIAAVAIMTAQVIYRPDEKIKALSTLQLAQQPAVEPTSLPLAYPHQNGQYPMNARINDYLQAHNGSIYTNGEANFRPFAKVSAASQE